MYFFYYMSGTTAREALRFILNRYLTIGALCAVIVVLCTRNPQDVPQPDLEIQVHADSTVDLYDTLHISITTEGDDGAHIDYCLAREGSWSVDTTADPGFTVTWSFPDTGTQRFIVWAIDSTGRCSNRDTLSTNVRLVKPTAALAQDTAVFVNHPLVVHVDGTSHCGSINRFEWSIDGTAERITGGTEDTLLLRWGADDTGCHTIAVTTVDPDGVYSDPDTQTVCVRLPEAHITIAGDTVVSINDTALFVCGTTEPAGGAGTFQWSTDPEGRFWFTTGSDTARFWWKWPDTGVKTVRARIAYAADIHSEPESLLVDISAQPPSVTISGPAGVRYGAAATFTAHASDEDGVITGYQWKFTGAPGDTTFTTADSSVSGTWSAEETGKKVVSVSVIDDDSLVSAAAICTVTVFSDDPELVPFPDTTVGSGDTIAIARRLADTTQSVALYFWDFDGSAGWDDSGVTSACTLSYAGTSPVRLITGVRNSEGKTFSDTTTIRFNRPPVVEKMSFTDNDTVWLRPGSLPGMLPFAVTALDPDDDAVSIALVWRSDTLAYTDTTRVPADSLGRYQWSVILTDSWGHDFVASGATCIGIEHTVCFAGHSIVAGLINDAANPSLAGGFRAGVLKGLRDSLGRYERVRPVGPFITAYMPQTPQDDSCFAVSGSYAREMYLLMEQAYPELTADIWVLMFGVNGSFGGVEIAATSAMIRTIFSRNPAARLYALTSPPYVSLSLVLYRNYNRNVRDTIAFWAADGFAGSVVEADSLLSDGYEIYDSLFSDDVHPNQAGYDLLRDRILENMWQRQPPPFEVKHEELF